MFIKSILLIKFQRNIRFSLNHSKRIRYARFNGRCFHGRGWIYRKRITVNINISSLSWKYIQTYHKHKENNFTMPPNRSINGGCINRNAIFRCDLKGSTSRFFTQNCTCYMSASQNASSSEQSGSRNLRNIPYPYNNQCVITSNLPRFQ